MKDRITRTNLPLVSVAPLPDPSTYENEYRYWPWGKLIDNVTKLVVSVANENATIFDYMCGTGFLLSRIRAQRPDIKAFGCDIHSPFVSHAEEKYPEIGVDHADARDCHPPASVEVLLCTGGLHHLSFEDQPSFLSKMAADCARDGIVIIGEEVLGPAASEAERLRAALLLNSDLIELGLRENWPKSMISAALVVLQNDALRQGEYKRDQAGWVTLIERDLEILDTVVTWPAPSGGGDVFFVCRPKSQSNASPIG